MAASIIQWNCRGFNLRTRDLIVLIHKHNPCAIALQETKKKEGHSINGFPKYSKYLKNYTDGRIACGGAALLVRNDLIQEKIELKTPLQAVAVRVTLYGRPISLVSLYLPPPRQRRLKRRLYRLLNQIPSPRFIIGDLNAHNPLWGGRRKDNRGRILEQLIDDHDLVLFNSKKPTYLDDRTGTTSCLDLCLGSPALSLEYEWDVHQSTEGSDHYPTLITNVVHQNRGEPRPSHWIMKKANVDSFDQLCNQRFQPDLTNHEQPMTEFTSILTEIAKASIPKSSAYPKRIPVPWYDDQCKNALKERKKACNSFKNNPSIENKIERNKQRAICQRLFRQKKRESWERYVSKLDTSVSAWQVWDMVKKISGKNSTTPLKPMIARNGDVLTSKPEIAAEIAKTFAFNSSSENLPPGFADVKRQAESVPLDINQGSIGDEFYNKDFSFSELKQALNPAKDTAPGPDDITNAILKLLPDSTLKVLLAIINKMWRTGEFPEEWRLATIIPIPKPDKDHSKPESFRPISLTSCLCKLVERMVNNRLIWFLEKNNLLSDWQSGARKNRSTLDQLIRLDTYVREALARRQHCVSVFFDIEKAYDTSWKYGVIRDLHDMGIRGNLLAFIKNYLTERSFKVRLGTTYSQSEPQEEGFPQGGVLSVTLFLIRVNKMPNAALRDTLKSLFVDDLNDNCAGHYMNVIERRLQSNIDKIHQWATNNGFKMSPGKTKCIHFCHKRNCPDPVLTMGGRPIAVVPHHKFLGLTFDKKLTFKVHIDELKERCMKAMNILKVVSHQNWGADRATKLRLWRALIRSKLDYGSIVYGGAHASDLKRLSVVQNTALRLSLGAFCTSPIVSLEVEANEPPMALRRDRLALLYAMKVRANPKSPVYKCLFESVSNIFINSSVAPSIGARLMPILQETAISFNNIAPLKVPIVPSSMLMLDNIDVDLTCLNKDITSNTQYMCEFFNLQRTKYNGFCEVYTDGSKKDNKSGYAIVFPQKPELCRSHRLPDGTSIFTAEALAIAHSLDLIKSIEEESRFVIYSDSLSCLQSIQHRQFDNRYIRCAANLLHKLREKDMEVHLCWIPSHVGINGNESADLNAKLALEVADDEVAFIQQPHNDSRQAIGERVRRIWQIAWDEVDNDLHRALPTLPYVFNSRLSRHEERVFARLHIGHTRYTHAYRLERTHRPLCPSCDTEITVQHILIDCHDYDNQRAAFYHANSINDLFNNVPPHSILEFIRSINLFDAI